MSTLFDPEIEQWLANDVDDYRAYLSLHDASNESPFDEAFAMTLTDDERDQAIRAEQDAAEQEARERIAELTSKIIRLANAHIHNLDVFGDLADAVYELEQRALGVR